MKLSFFNGFLYAFNPSSFTFISPRKSQVLFYQPAISVSRCGSFPFQRLFRACLNSGFATKVLSVGFLNLGLDALRAWTNNVQLYIPIYVAPRDFEVMKKTHYYTVDTSMITPGAAV